MSETNTMTAFDALATETSAHSRAEFSETGSEILQRHLYGAAWGLKTYGLSGFINTMGVLARDTFRSGTDLPDPTQALEAPWGLAGMVKDFSSESIMKAYRQSMFPWAHIQPLKWWSLPERMVIKPSEYRFTKRLRRTVRKAPYRVSFDTDFAGVMNACSESRHDGRYLTWLTPVFKRAYMALHEEGHAHSFEVWDEDNALVGGGYGLAVGGVFHTESQFSRKSNTSKIGFITFNHHLASMDFALNDGKWETPTLVSMGFARIPRCEFMATLDAHGDRTDVPVGRWQGETDLQKIAEWQPDIPDE